MYDCMYAGGYICVCVGGVGGGVVGMLVSGVCVCAGRYV